jgi:ABC-2 type transport system permease protein
MRNIVAIARRELLSFFVSPLAYFIITGFLVLAGYFFAVLLLYFNEMSLRMGAMPNMQGPKLNLNEWVVERLYGTMLVVLVFMVPLLTMRTVAEDKKKGTFELLLTSPVSVLELVLGKYLGVGILITVMIGSLGIFPLILMWFGNPQPEFLPMLSGLLGVLLCALAFASIGLAVSAFADSQIVAGLITMVALLLLYVINSPAESVGGVTGAILKYLSPTAQVRDMLKGVISTSSLCYFFSLISFGLFSSLRALEFERLR